MPAVATSAFSVAFGDFAQFFVRLVGGVRFERSDDFAFGTDLVTFRCLLRGDGTLVDTNAVKVYKGPPLRVAIPAGSRRPGRRRAAVRAVRPGHPSRPRQRGPAGRPGGVRVVRGHRGAGAAAGRAGTCRCRG